ncbi:Ribosomal protein S15 [Dillenia turbinata]|uniref:Small ribosomal subunit protein uS15c n=1 Tax=Dillenia turbinata TaxID=194707 RepID=A0AAN8WA91_9MAGN
MLVSENPNFVEMASSVVLRLNPRRKISIQNPSFLHFFSSSSDSNSNVEDSSSPQSPSHSSSSSSSFSSYFSDVKASLKKNSQPPPPPRRQFSPLSKAQNSPPNQPSNFDSLEKIRNNLAEFRRRTSPPSPQSPSSSPISFQELFKRNVLPTGQDSKSDSMKAKTRMVTFESISESLKHLRRSAATNNAVPERVNSSILKDGLKLRSTESESVVIGGAEKFPESVFSKEMKEKKEMETAAMRTDFVKTYSYGDLGEKLRKLRPERKLEDNWFSLKELNERLMKLREIEDKESEARVAGVSIKDLRECFTKLSISELEKHKKQSTQRIAIWNRLGGSPDYMLSPPKEHLYFHPDHMSSAEKLKLELQKVRDQFKMSESDCGSARVQIAQLTTKIKHLAGVLHKKDKHSRKGLHEMVQRRKKLLKYLRRTDWDSYCFVLSKLGLRDNPNYKN